MSSSPRGDVVLDIVHICSHSIAHEMQLPQDSLSIKRSPMQYSRSVSKFSSRNILRLPVRPAHTYRFPQEPEHTCHDSESCYGDGQALDLHSEVMSIAPGIDV